MNMSNVIGKFGSFLNGKSQQSIPNHTDIRDKHQRADGTRDSVLVIDASGSMYETDWKPSRLRAAQQAAATFVERLAADEPDAKVAIIAYGFRAKVFSELTLARRRHELVGSIDSIHNLGGTNITSGLKAALRLLENSQGLGQVVLLTDGRHILGPGPKRVSDKLKELAIIECVGIGGRPKDVNEKLLRYVASSYPDGSKRYRWIGDKERLVQHFHNLAGRIVRA